MIEGFSAAVDTAKKQFLASDLDTSSPEFYVCQWLSKLLHSENWDDKESQFFLAWIKKLDIAKKHFQVYESQWKPAIEKLALDEESYRLSALVALRHLSSLEKHDVDVGQILKTINVIFKILNRIDGVFGLKNVELTDMLSNMLLNVQKNKRQPSQIQSSKQDCQKILPVTVLFSEGPIARAYLETIYGMGLKVEKIIQLVSSIDLVSKKSVGKFLPSMMRLNYAANKQFKQMFYWPNQMKQKHANEVKTVQQAVEVDFGFNAKQLGDSTDPKELTSYSDCVEQLFVTGLKDPALLEKIQQQKSELFLFTGGGIVPDALLEIGNKKLIHIHPGFLPDVRGADCVLWSQMVYGRVSASAFFLAPGIDVGDVILPCWLPDLELNIPQNSDLQFQYRLIYGFLDPWVRSYVLRLMIESTSGLQHIDSIPQNEKEGLTYHFMHEKVKSFAVKQFSSSVVEE